MRDFMLAMQSKLHHFIPQDLDLTMSLIKDLKQEAENTALMLLEMERSY